MNPAIHQIQSMLIKLHNDLQTEQDPQMKTMISDEILRLSLHLQEIKTQLEPKFIILTCSKCEKQESMTAAQAAKFDFNFICPACWYEEYESKNG